MIEYMFWLYSYVEHNTARIHSSMSTVRTQQQHAHTVAQARAEAARAEPLALRHSGRLTLTATHSCWMAVHLGLHAAYARMPTDGDGASPSVRGGNDPARALHHLPRMPRYAPIPID